MSYEFYNALVISNLQRIKAAFIYIGLLSNADPLSIKAVLTPQKASLKTIDLLWVSTIPKKP